MVRKLIWFQAIAFCLPLVGQNLKPDPFAAAFAKDQQAIALFLKSLDNEQDPTSRFLICAMEVIEINKFLANPENEGSINFVYKSSDGHEYGPGEIPRTEDEITKHKDAAKANVEKIAAGNQKLAVKRKALEMMREEIGKMEPAHQELFTKFLKSLR